MATSRRGTAAALGPDPSCAIILVQNLSCRSESFDGGRGTGLLRRLEMEILRRRQGKYGLEFRVFCSHVTELITATSDRRLARYDVGTGTLIRETLLCTMAT